MGKNEKNLKKKRVSVLENKFSAPKPIPKLNLDFSSRYWNRILVSHYKECPLSNLHVNCRIVDVWIFRLGDCNSIIVIYSQAINHGFGCWITRVNGPILAFFTRKIFHTFITAVTLCKNWGFYLEKKMLCMNIQSQMAYLELSIAHLAWTDSEIELKRIDQIIYQFEV